MSTHYETLGVPPTASSDDIRRAYRRLAQRFHPDRHLQSPAGEAANASRRMRDINRAWSVLSDADARQHYDLELALARTKAARSAPGPTRPAPTSARPSTGSSPRPEPAYHAGYVDVAPGYGVWTAIFRAVPWLLVVVVLGGIFVFTAFAAADRDSATPEQPIVATTASVGDCIRRLSPTALGIVDCSRANDGRIVEKVSVGRPCPRDSTAIYLPDETVNACIRPY